MRYTTALAVSWCMAVALLAGPSRANAQTGKTFRFVGVGEDPEWAIADPGVV